MGKPKAERAGVNESTCNEMALACSSLPAVAGESFRSWLHRSVRCVGASDHCIHGMMKMNQHEFVMIPAAKAIFHRAVWDTDHRFKNQRANKKIARPE